MASILLIDNHDSFTYNLYHLFKKCGQDITVKKIETVTDGDMSECTAVVLGPGPGIPSENERLLELTDYAIEHKVLLGICLGMQAIQQALGGELIRLKAVQHGQKTKLDRVDKTSVLYRGISDEILVGRYHSWVVNHEHLAIGLKPTAYDKAGFCMSFEHEERPVFAVQYHPESYMCSHGMAIINNFLKLIT